MNSISLTGSSALIDPSLLQSAGSPEFGQRSTAAAAREFESLLASLLVKTMRESMSEEGLFAGDPSGTYGSLFDRYMGQHLAQNSGLGVARALEAYLDHSSPGSAGGPPDDGSLITRG